MLDDDNPVGFVEDNLSIDIFPLDSVPGLGVESKLPVPRYTASGPPPKPRLSSFFTHKTSER